MGSERPILMIPGPVEVSPAVLAAYSTPPPSHLAPGFVDAFGRALSRMRTVWKATDDSQPFVVAGSGTLAMDMAVANLMAPGERAVVVDTGFFSGRMAEMLRRRGVVVTAVAGEPGETPALEDVEKALDGGSFKALFATHVDTSTAVRVDARGLAALARRSGVLSVFDGVCATAGERFEMGAWGADVYLTASQKALGLPPGLALQVASPRALEARAALASPPPLSLDWLAWRPIMEAYEGRRPSYFATPATPLVAALDVGLGEVLAATHDSLEGIDARIAQHAQVASRLRRAWQALGLSPLPRSEGLAANTLSALRYPAGVDAALLPRIAARGVVVAGGLYPGLQSTYFRVGHMGYAVTQPALLRRTLRAVAGALEECGHRVDEAAAVDAFEAELD